MNRRKDLRLRLKEERGFKRDNKGRSKDNTITILKDEETAALTASIKGYQIQILGITRKDCFNRADLKNRH